MMRRALAVIAALAVVVIPLSACSASTDREAVRSDQSVDGVNGGGSTLEACAEYSEQPSCVLDATQTGVTVLNGSSLLFGGAGSEPAESVELTKVCWSPAGEVEPIDCDTDGKPMTPGLVTQATISGYPALSFAAEKISDPSPDAPEDGVYPLPALIYLNVDGREVMVEIACCTTLP
jgi:hypothetical protein